MSPQKHTKQSGFAGLEIIIVAAVVIAAIIYVSKSNLNLQSLLGTPTPLASPSIEPTPTETATPSSSPTPTQTPKATPKPTSSATPAPKAVSGPPGSGYSRLTVHTEVGDFTASIVSIDMAGVRMITDTASDDNCTNDCPTSSLSDFVARNGAFAGINGSYFCPGTYPDCQDKKNSFDFPVYNTRLSKWINEDKLSWNSRGMVYFDGGGIHFKKEANSFGGGATAGVTNYPSLLDGGNVVVGDYIQSDKQQTKGTKGGIGIRGNVVYLIIASNVTMTEFANIFKSLGAEYALNLDGGGSSALWFGGYKVGPGRALPNAVLFAR